MFLWCSCEHGCKKKKRQPRPTGLEPTWWGWWGRQFVRKVKKKELQDRSKTNYRSSSQFQKSFGTFTLQSRRITCKTKLPRMDNEEIWLDRLVKSWSESCRSCLWKELKRAAGGQQLHKPARSGSVLRHDRERQQTFYLQNIRLRGPTPTPALDIGISGLYRISKETFMPHWTYINNISVGFYFIFKNRSQVTCLLMAPSSLQAYKAAPSPDAAK